MIETFRESKRITQAEYCPTRQVPLSLEEILLQEVKREDEINHAGESYMTEVPKFEVRKVDKSLAGWMNFAKTILLDKGLKQLRP